MKSQVISTQIFDIALTTRRSATSVPGSPEATHSNRLMTVMGLEPAPVVVRADHDWMYLAGAIADSDVVSRTNSEGFNPDDEDLSDVGFVDRAVTDDPTDALIEALDSGMPFEVYRACATADDDDMAALDLTFADDEDDDWDGEDLF